MFQHIPSGHSPSPRNCRGPNCMGTSSPRLPRHSPRSPKAPHAAATSWRDIAGWQMTHCRNLGCSCGNLLAENSGADWFEPFFGGCSSAIPRESGKTHGGNPVFLMHQLPRRRIIATDTESKKIIPFLGKYCVPNFINCWGGLHDMKHGSHGT